MTGPNNTFSYQWADGKTYQVILNAPSEQTIPGIAQYLQVVMFNNGHYIINTATGAVIYYLSLAFNQILYRTTISATPLPTTMPANSTYGTSTSAAQAWTLPSSPNIPSSLSLPLPPTAKVRCSRSTRSSPSRPSAP